MICKFSELPFDQIANWDSNIQKSDFTPGVHKINSPVVGTRAKELQAVKSAAEIHPILFQLEKAIYLDKFTYLIPLDKKDEADAAARHIFLDYIQKYASAGYTENNIVDWQCQGLLAASNKTYIEDVENQWNTWHVKINIESRHDNFNEKYDKYLPPHVAAYHEIMHAEEIPKKSPKEFEWELGIELLTTIKTFILLDKIYKTIHVINEDFEVDYDKNIEIKGHSISLGSFANFYRELEKKYGKLYLALVSSESIDFLSKHFPHLAEKTVTINDHTLKTELLQQINNERAHKFDERNNERARERDEREKEENHQDAHTASLAYFERAYLFIHKGT